MPDLRFTSVPSPPAGTDWQFVVPGQYVYHLTSVSASLVKGGATPTVCHDSSGNGFNGTYDPFATGGLIFGQPGLVAGDFCIQRTPAGSAIAQVPADGTLFTGDFYINFWQTDGGVGGSNEPVVFLDAFSDNRVQVTLEDSPPDPLNFKLTFQDGINPAQAWQCGGGAATGGTHMYSVTYNFGTSTPLFYIDGVNVPVTSHAGTAVLQSDAATCLVGGQISTPGFHDEYAWGPGIPSGAQLANLFAQASVSFGAYSAAQLALTPEQYYHLNETGGAGGPRSVNLDVSDGTNLVLEVAPPTPGSGATILQYSWLPNLQSDFTTADGSTVIVGTPDLILSAGYTIGTRTPDLAPADQWSNVTIWWYDELAFLLISILDYHDILIIG